MQTFRWTTHSPEETIALARQIGARLHAGDVLAYRGGLGAGKTTFTRGIALGMGLDDLVTSPTFALVNAYGDPPRLIHFDMYRIDGAEELETTGWYDYPQQDCVFAVEWSENIADALPPETIVLTLTRTGDDERRITLKGDARFAVIGT